MSIFKKTIFTGFSPNLTGRDTARALSYLLLPWRWARISSGRYVVLAEKKLREYFSVRHAYTFDSGRSALYYGLKTLGAGEGDEILVEAYTCVVVVNAIKFTGAKPIFVDIGDNFNIDPANLENKITAKSKILIIQHTFGLPAKLQEILAIAKRHNLKIIEDCAHSLGSRYQGELTGTFGHIGMLSFGSDKIISCVRGGALITDNQEIGLKIKELKNQLPEPSLIKTIQHLLHYPIFYISKPIYNLFIGKIILILAKKLNIINKIIYKQEKAGELVKFYPASLANALANILCYQIDEIDRLNSHRQNISEIYTKEINNQEINLPWRNNPIDFKNCACLRYPILLKNPNQLLSYAKKQGAMLGDWYNVPIAPADINFKKTGYLNDCPKAEFLASRSINLPTDRHIKLSDAKRIVKIINSFSGSN
ncbi:MAG: aminotransferase class I/II-fold pyridoxal phosphate-dependent enzyme [Patescibacteria group bacterium]|nr:aminotransferase class I/II-fold pyridoxal phosphate-dependent enzyme [Patescibacteria group bacterium]